MNDLIEDLAIDTRAWGRWEPERLYGYLQRFWKAGYRGLPEKIILDHEQRAYLLSLMMPLLPGQPLIRIEYLDAEKRDSNGKMVKVREKIITPFAEMRIDVVGKEWNGEL